MINELCQVLSKSYDRGWISTRDGNGSFKRKNSPFIHITPSGVRKNVLRVEDIIKMKIQDGQLIIPDGVKPSGELHMHWLLQQIRNKTTAVLHVHPTNVIAAMYAGWDLQKLALEFPELGRYTTVGPTVPVLPVTSKELGDATFNAMTGDGILYDIVGQDRHGVCSIAGDPWSAYEHVERLEHICEIVLKSGIHPNR